MNANNLLSNKVISIIGVGICYASQALAASGSEPIVNSNGSVLTYKNPGTGPNRITYDQMLNSQPKAISTPKSVLKEINGSSQTETLYNPSRQRVIEPVLPDLGADDVAKKEYPNDWATYQNGKFQIKYQERVNLDDDPESCSVPSASGLSPMLDCYYHPSTTTPGSILTQYQTKYPWKTVGKLYFHDYDEGIDHYYHHCTAQVISGPPNNLLVTAGHCVVDPGNGHPSKDMFFVPAYSNGSAPYGQFKYRISMALPDFVKSHGERRYDVALISLENDDKDNPVSYYTGTLGLILNASYYQNVMQIGYSTSQVFDGAWTSLVNTQTYKYIDQGDCTNKLSSEDVLYSGSPLGPGSSGGAWINSFYPFDESVIQKNYVASVVSGRDNCVSSFGMDIPLPNILVGPLLSDNNIGILCANIVGGCSSSVTTKTLAVTVTGDGAVMSTPSGIYCTEQGKDCTFNFNEKGYVTLSAIPDRGNNIFVAWGGACKGKKRSCRLDMSTDKQVTAKFKAN